MHKNLFWERNILSSKEKQNNVSLQQKHWNNILEEASLLVWEKTVLKCSQLCYKADMTFMQYD